MRFEGTLAQWNDDRGFGFIQPTEGGQTLFAHISAFPRDGQRPQLNERLSFEVTLGQGGKKQATAIQRPRAMIDPSQRRQHPPRMARTTSTGMFGKLVALLLLCALLGAGYWKYEARQQQALTTGAAQETWNDAAPVRSDGPATPAPLASSPYRCDGRQHCSQMTSCAEAKFFLKNCPDPKMDGNHDGVPCEQQWCTHPFAN